MLHVHRKRAHADRGQEGGDEEHGHDHPPCRQRDIAAGVLGLLRQVRDRLDPGVGHHRDRDAGEEASPRRRDAEVDVVQHGLDVEDQDQAEDHEHELGDQVGEREHQVEDARLLDADDVDHDQKADQERGRADVRRVVVAQEVEEPDVLAEDAEVADGEVGGDRRGRRVVQELDPADDESDRLVERAPGEARAAAGVGQGGGSLGVVERGGDEDEAGQDERHRREAESEGGRDAERVVDARADVAVAGGEERARAERAGELGGAADDDPEVTRPAAAAGHRITHRARA